MRRIPKVRFQARAMGIALLAILLGRKIICLGRPPLKPETLPSLPPFPVSKATRNAGIAVVPLNHHGKVVTENLTRQSWPPVIVSFLFLLLPSPPPTEWPRNRSYGTNFTGNNYRRKPSPIQSFPSEQTTGFSVDGQKRAREYR